MPTVAQALALLETIDVIEIAGEALLERKEEIIGINQHQLYEQGIGYDGLPLPPYSKEYAKKKPRGIVDIWKSGKLQTQMNLTVIQDRFVIDSAAQYSPYVQGRRPTIYGLDDDGKQIACDIITPVIVEKIKQKLQIS